MSESSVLPTGWAYAAVNDLCQFNPKTVADDEATCGFASMHGLGTNYRAHLRFEARPWSDVKKAYTHFKNGDVLVAKVTPCFENGKAGIARGLPNGIGAGSSEFCVFRPAPGVDQRYLLAWLSTEDFRKRATVAMTGSVGLKRVPKEVFLSEQLPVAPEHEQQRIADKLDTVLGRVDAVNDRLARVAPMLKRFRQAVLAAATSGRLTADWRNDEAFNGYPKKRLAEFGTARLGKMLDKQKNTGIETRYLRNVNVRWFGFDLADLQTLKIEPHERESLRVVDGDLLICEGGEPGRCAVWEMGATDIVFQKAIHRVRVDHSKALPQWVAYTLKSLCDSSALNDLFTGTTIKHLTGIALTQIHFPLPEVPEQTEIVRRADILFAYADRLEARLQAAQAATARLTPALLAKAFRGELVPQDPADEPAAELLRRLSENQGNAKVKAKKRRQVTP